MSVVMAIGRHVFVADATATTWDGKPGCAHCALPAKHEIHEMPDNPAAEEEARRYGEREGEQ
jgi:hypothetical protein